MERNFTKDGIILLNKSKGISSFKAIDELKRKIKAKKAGHAGTLDPMAEGLMVVMINDATKFSGDLMKKDKEYYVEMELGYKTDTYDSEGKVIEEYKSEIELSDSQIIRTIHSFKGRIKQVPPMYSAIKVEGQKLYDLARKGIEIERMPRDVEIMNIYKIKIHRSKENSSRIKISFYAHVSSGTYIRSLVHDIGEKLKVFATMTKLVRTKIGRLSIEDAVSLEEVQSEIGKLKELVEEKRENESFWATKSDAAIRAEKIREIVCFVEIEYILDYYGINVSNEKYGKLKNGMTVIDTFKKFENIGKDIKRQEHIRENQKFKIYVRNRDTQKREFKGIVKIVSIRGNRIYLKRDKYFL
ncbi:tRNA pseudouridine(55) synthase TruB [Leptotrichia buccalis]